MVLQGSFPNQEKLLTTRRSKLHKLLTQLVGWRIFKWGFLSKPGNKTNYRVHRIDLRLLNCSEGGSQLYTNRTAPTHEVHLKKYARQDQWWIINQKKGLTKQRAGWAQFKTWNKGTYLELVVPRSQTKKFPVSRTWLLSWSKLPSNHLLACITAVPTHPCLNTKYWGKTGMHSAYLKTKGTELSPIPINSWSPSVGSADSSPVKMWWVDPTASQERLLRGNCWI